MRRRFMANYREVIEYITTSQTWTVPAGVSSLDVFLVSGGGGGGGWSYWGGSEGGPGGGGGSLTRSRKLGNAIPVTPGIPVQITIGSGGAGGKGHTTGGPGADGTHTLIRVNGLTYQTEAVGKGGSASVYQSIPPTVQGGNQGHNGISNNSTVDGAPADLPAVTVRYGSNGVHEFWEAERPIHAAGGNLYASVFNKTDFTQQSGESPVGKRDVQTIYGGKGGGGYGGGGGGGYYGMDVGNGDRGGRGGDGVCVIRYLKQV